MRCLFCVLALLPLCIVISTGAVATGDDFSWIVVQDTDWANSRNWRHLDNPADGVGGPGGFDDGEIPDDGSDRAFVRFGSDGNHPILDQNRLIGQLVIELGGRRQQLSIASYRNHRCRRYWDWNAQRAKLTLDGRFQHRFSHHL